MRDLVQRLFNVGQPLGVVGTTPVDVIEVQALQLFGDRTTGAVADVAAIQFADRRHFGGGAGEEGFVGNVDFIAGDALFVNFQPLFRAMVKMVSRVMPSSALVRSGV